MSKIKSKLTPFVTALAVILSPTIALADPPTGMVKATGLTSLHAPDGTEIDCQTELEGTITQTGQNPASYSVTITSGSFAPGNPKCVGVQANFGGNGYWMGTFGPASAGFSPLSINGVEIDIPSMGLMCGPGIVSAPYYDSPPKTVDFGSSTPLSTCSIDNSLTISPL